MFHTIIIVGNLGRDPEMRYTPSGQAVTDFSIATSRTYTGSNGQQVKETIWFRVTAWGKQGEFCNNYLKKGYKVLVEGRLTADLNTHGPRIYSRQDGTSGANFEVVASTVRNLTPRQNDEGGSGFSGGGEDYSAPIGGEDEIPF